MTKKPDGVAQQYYAPHLMGGRFYNNPSNTELAGIERVYMRRLREMCMNRFTWHGLPDSIDPRFVETILFEQALIVYCRPEEFNPMYPDGTPMNKPGETVDMMLRATPTGYLDYQDNPLAYTVFANQMFTKMYDADQVVPVWANQSRVPDLDVVMWYSRRLAEAERTTDLNLKNARYSRIMTVPEEQRQTAVNILRKIDEGQPAIFGTDTLELNMFNTLDWEMDHEILQAVQVAKNQIMNDCLTMLGINNANQDKKERLISGEVDARSEQVGVNRAIALGERQRGAERINEMFGTNISVEWNEEIIKTEQTGNSGDAETTLDENHTGGESWLTSQ